MPSAIGYVVDLMANVRGGVNNSQVSVLNSVSRDLAVYRENFTFISYHYFEKKKPILICFYCIFYITYHKEYWLVGTIKISPYAETRASPKL